jgi:hypothetical protein
MSRSVCLVWLLALWLCGGCSLIYDGEGDCSVHFLVRFVADMNLAYSDVFAEEVPSVSLYVFDEDETLVWVGYATAEELNAGGGRYVMEISDLPAGNYHLVAWGGLENNSSFSVPVLTIGSSKLNDLTCSLNRKTRADEKDLSDTDLDPLFHGMADFVIPEEPEPGTYDVEMQLTQDTNQITVYLQEMDGSELNQEDYEFMVEANNGHINHDNSLLIDETPIKYVTWSQYASAVRSTFAETAAVVVRSAEETTTDAEQRSVGPEVVGKLTLSRLVIDDWAEVTRPMLTIKQRSTGQTLLSIPLIDYALMVRRISGSQAEEQEYLDRQSHYDMTFYLENGQWMSHEVVINSWRIILIDANLD